LPRLRHVSPSEMLMLLMEQKLAAILPCNDLDAAEAFFKRRGFSRDAGSHDDYPILFCTLILLSRVGVVPEPFRASTPQPLCLPASSSTRKVQAPNRGVCTNLP
jgi:hypothetical protein